MHLFHLYYLATFFLLLPLCLQLWNLYFIVGRRKLTPNVTPNTLESMIEYTLISSILDRIYKMTKKLLEYLRNDTRLDYLWHLFKIKTWGTKWKKVIDKIDEWAAWRWANAKIDKESFTLFKQIVHITKEDMEDYNLVMFTHAMDFFKKHTDLKSILEHFFTSLLNDLSTKYLVTLGNLLSTKFMKLNRWLYAIASRWTCVPQELRHKMLNHLVNCGMIVLLQNHEKCMMVENKNMSKMKEGLKLNSLH